MADLRSFSREFLTEFIAIYEESPCLWQIKSKDYSNKQKKNAAYQKLIKKLEEVEKNATKDSVVKKINSLRTCFRKEYRKVLASERSGAGTDDLYMPSLWYYDLLLFLLEQEEPKSSRSTVPDEEVEETLQEQNTQSLSVPEDETQNSTLENEGNDETQRSTTDYESGPISPTASCITSSGSRSPSSAAVTHRSAVFSPVATSMASSGTRTPCSKGAKRIKKADAVLDLVAQKLQSTVDNPREFDNYAKHVAEQMRQVSKQQAIFLTKIINDAIFEAQCGTLTQKSCIVSNPVGISVGESRYCPPSTSVYNMQHRNTDVAPIMHTLQPVPAYSNYQEQRPVSDTLAEFFSNVTP